MHLGFCSSLGVNNGGTHTVPPPLLDNTPSLLAVPLCRLLFSQHTLLPVDVSLLVCVHPVLSLVSIGFLTKQGINWKMGLNTKQQMVW